MLFIKKSGIPNSGEGLWTDSEIKKGAVVCEYEGEKITWAECEKRNEERDGVGDYFFHVTDKNCVDGYNTLEAFGRYANDAAGLTRVKGIRNNCIYDVKKGKPFIIATRRIKAGEEIHVSYGRAYWNTYKSELAKAKKRSGNKV